MGDGGLFLREDEGREGEEEGEEDSSLSWSLRSASARAALQIDRYRELLS